MLCYMYIPLSPFIPPSLPTSLLLSLLPCLAEAVLSPTGMHLIKSLSYRIHSVVSICVMYYHFILRILGKEKREKRKEKTRKKNGKKDNMNSWAPSFYCVARSVIIFIFHICTHSSAGQ